jgi:hypothetical protein
MVAASPCWGWKMACTSGYQGAGGTHDESIGIGDRGSGDHAPGPEKPKIDEKAYKAALERVPTPKEKYDPWGGVAPAPAPTTAAKKK